MNLIMEIQAAIKTLDTMISEMKKRGQDYAQARSAYEIEKAKTILEYREQGQPVTLTLDLTKGNVKVNKLRLDKDIAETLYKTVQEAIQTQKLKIRIMEAQVQREWGRNE